MSTGSVFYPSLAYIVGITNAQFAVVEFEDPHSFTLGELISLRVTAPYGMPELNNKTSRVVQTTSTTVTLEIDTTFLNHFIYPAEDGLTPPTAVPAGSSVIPNPVFPFSPQGIPTVNLQDAFDNIPVG